MTPVLLDKILPLLGRPVRFRSQETNGRYKDLDCNLPEADIVLAVEVDNLIASQSDSRHWFKQLKLLKRSQQVILES